MDAASDWLVRDGQYALDFDGSNDRVDTSFLIPSTDFTFAIWYNVSSLAELTFNRPCGDTNALTGQSGVSVIINLFGGGDIYVVVRQGANVNSGDLRGGTVAVGVWQHVVVTMSSVAGVTLWADGKVAASNSTYKFITQTGGGWKIGADAIQGKFAGLIADNTVWNRVLNRGEIDVLYKLGRGGMYKPRSRRRSVFLGPSFNAAWARGSNQFIQPSLIGVA